MTGVAPTALQSALASRILSHARQSGWAVGHHLTENSLLPVVGTSRSPVRAAMAHLEASGVLERRPNRGYFLKSLPEGAPPPDAAEADQGGDKLYIAIAMDRVGGALSDVVSENELMRRYDVSRAQLRLALARIAAEGWIARKPGRGWAFQPLIDSIKAYREIYRYRLLMEPAAMRSPEFRADPDVLRKMRARQVFVRDEGYRNLSQIELFEINNRFHIGLAEMSNNRFIVQTLTRLNHLRRLNEYRRPIDRERARRVCREHVGIIDALLAGDIALAATRLETDIGNSIIAKALREDEQENDHGG